MHKFRLYRPILSNLELLIIFVVFAVTGSSAVYVARPFLDLIGLVPDSFTEAWWGNWAYWSLRIFLIFPFYQVLLLFFGWLFGQFRFFWNFEKKMMQRVGLGFIFRND